LQLLQTKTIMENVMREDTAIGPNYLTRGVPEIDENPLTAHLPLSPETDDDAFKALGLRPNFQASDRNLSNSIRRLYIKRLRNFYVPTLKVHRQALMEISSNILDGYIQRNPMTAGGQVQLYGGSVDLTFRPSISLVAGHSGMGKSAMITRILGHMGNQLQQHVGFDGKAFAEKQILFLRRNCPEHCTVGTLCSTFGDYTDKVLGLKLYSGVFAKLQGGSRTNYLSEISKIIRTHHVGVLVIDEFQNLSLMGVGAKKIIALLVNLRDELGLPIVVVGTYKALHLLEGNMSTARRLADGGYYDLERPASAEEKSWTDLCQIAWRYQWVRNPVEFDSDICEALYDVSQGITGIMLSAFAFAQLDAIENEIERVDAALIRKVYMERMKPLHPAIRILQSGNPVLMDKFDDLYKNLWPTMGINEESAVPKSPISPNDDLSAGREEDIEKFDVAATHKRTRSNRNVVATPTTPVKPLLSEEQVKKMVMADSVADLLTILDKR
jgi:hypothetical protein